MSFKNFLALKASAGTGKTFRLTTRFISIMLMGEKPENIVALTFTNKAAGEMEDRIKKIIQKPEENKKEILFLSEEMKIPENEILKKIKELPVVLNLKISTIDSFLSNIVETFASHVGINSDFKPGTISEEKEINEFLKFLKRKNEIKKLVDFSNATKKTVDSIIEDLKIMNSKEKEVEEYFKKFLIENNGKENNVKKTEKEIMNVLYELKSIVIERGGSKTAINSFEAKDVESLLEKNYLSRSSLNYRTFSSVYSEDFDMLFFKLKEKISFYLQEKENEFLKGLFFLYKEYKEGIKEIKKQDNILTFSDITNVAKEIMSSADLEYLKFRIDSKIKHLMIDEFQDTSWTQFQILKPIIDEIVFNKEKSFKSFFIVGDVKQSIYRFRGGNSDLFNKVVADYSLEEEKLKINYRSSKNIVNFVDDVFSIEYDNYEKQSSIKGENEDIQIIEESSCMETALLNILKEKEYKNIDLSDVTILTATNNESLKLKEKIKEEYNSLNIITDSSSKIIESKKVKLLLNLVKFFMTDEDFYIHNFNGILNNKKYSINEYREKISKMEHLADVPAIFLKTLIEEYSLFDGDLNIIKILEVANKYDAIELFMDELETIEDSIVNSEENTGLRIMTMHKSKGLEFDHVILYDDKKQRNYSKGLILEFNTDIEIIRVWKDFKNRELVDPNFNIAKAKEKVKDREDLMNILYVAYTRAVKTLTIIKNENSSKTDSLVYFEAKQKDI